jgi:hypothetical protein
MFNFNSPLIPAIFAIIGTILGAVIGGVIPHFLREKSAYKTFRRNKLEELYDDINNWINYSFMIPINFYLVFSKTIDWNGYLDKIIETEPGKSVKIFKSEIIINLYFKELVPDFNKLTKAYQNINGFINHEIKNAYLAGDEILIFKSEFDAKVKGITDLVEKLKEHIKTIAQKI